jgi:hypothetical protein
VVGGVVLAPDVAVVVVVAVDLVVVTVADLVVVAVVRTADLVAVTEEVPVGAGLGVWIAATGAT